MKSIRRKHMDRIQPPPNYYGGPYSQNDNLGQTQPYPPQMNGYNMNPSFVPPPIKNDSRIANQIEEFYESFNKLVQTNLGRHVIVHCSFTDSTKWHDKEFEGVLASAGDNYIIVFNQNENKHYLIVGVYIDFIEFTEKIIIDGNMSK